MKEKIKKKNPLIKLMKKNLEKVTKLFKNFCMKKKVTCLTSCVCVRDELSHYNDHHVIIVRKPSQKKFSQLFLVNVLKANEEFYLMKFNSISSHLKCINH